MRTFFLAGLLFAAAAFAGCTGTDTVTTLPPASNAFDPAVLSAKAFKVLPPVEAWVTAADGVRLHNAVYRPDTPEKVPVFVNFSPYWGDTAMAEGDHFAQYMIQEYVPRGYAVVLSALRGTGHSEGCFQIGGDVEVEDAYAVVDAFAKAEWSSGNVAAGGKSYDSTTQNGLVAKKPHPALKGIFHVSGITDMYRYNAKDGVVYANGLDFTPRYFLMQGLDEYAGATNGAGSPQDESPDSLRRLTGDLSCTELAGHLVSGEGTAADGRRDAYWDERDWVSALPGSDWGGSVFFVHGLQDWNVKPDNIDPWLDILQAKGTKVIGWLHQETENLGHLYPMRGDWNETMLRWLDGTLKGKDTRLGDLWGFDVQGSDKAPGAKANTWRHSATWPPAGSWTTVETLEWKAAAPTRVSGVPFLAVAATPTGPDDIARAVLYRKDARGGLTWVNEAVDRLALSDDETMPAPYAPGTSLTLNLTFYPMDLELDAGDSLVLALGGDAREAGPNGESTPAGFFYRPEQVAQVAYGNQVALHLPIAAPGGELAPQPGPTKCFAC